MKTKSILRALAMVICMALSFAIPAAAAPVEVEGGLVQGVTENGITVYKGIPFAAAPVGDLRWRPPQPVKTWEGVRHADKFAPACSQVPIRIPGWPELETSEDCLYLNIWTPAQSPAEKRPVMVWIYGGGFALGTTSMNLYSGEQLARKGVVFVSIAYRLGPLGFMAHPDLSAESARQVSGNYGLHDQISALQWVQRNIASFGGDPGRVTVFGESAGAISVSMLCASPLAQGLFQRAISQSGGSFAPTRTAKEIDSMQLLAGAEQAGLEFARRMGAATLAELRKLPHETFLKDPQAQMGGFWPIIDGYVISDDQYKLYQSGRYHDVDVLIGTNSDEGAMFVRPTSADQYAVDTRVRFGPFADAVLKLYPGQTDAQALRSTADVFRDTVFGWPTWTWAKLQSGTGRSKVFVYYFDQQQPALPFPMPLKPVGASHGAEMAYIFQHLEQNPMLRYTQEDRELSETMAAYWTHFAKNGDPNGPGLPHWPVYKEGEATIMYLKNAPAPGLLPNRDKLLLIDEYFAWKRAVRE